MSTLSFLVNEYSIALANAMTTESGLLYSEYHIPSVENSTMHSNSNVCNEIKIGYKSTKKLIELKTFSNFMTCSSLSAMGLPVL